MKDQRYLGFREVVLAERNRFLIAKEQDWNYKLKDHILSRNSVKKLEELGIDSARVPVEELFDEYLYSEFETHIHYMFETATK